MRKTKEKSVCRNEIVFYDEKGKELGRVQRTNHQRMSVQAAWDHKKMDAFKQSHPSAHTARLVGYPDVTFEFDKNGRSISTLKF